MGATLTFWAAAAEICRGQRLEFALSTKTVPAAGFGARVSPRQGHLLAAMRLAPNKSRTLYTIPLFFSERRVRVEVAVDTGSAVLWLHREQCVEGGRQVCGREVGPMSYGYLDGGLSGEVVAMDVFLGPEPRAPRNAGCQVLLASKTDPGVTEPILGLGPPLGVRGPTFLDRLVANGVIPEPVFTFDLSAGRFFFGPEEGAPRPRWAIDYGPRGNYSFRIQRISFNGFTLSAQGGPAILDSGNTLIALSVALLPGLLAAARRTGARCETRPEPNPHFVELWCSKHRGDFSGLALLVGGQRIVFGFPGFFFGGCDAGPRPLCRTVLEFHSHGSFGTIVGQPLFRQFVVTFDQLRRRIYLARPRTAVADSGLDAVSP